mgnify:FL=1
MKITEIENKDLKIEKIAMSCDKTITDTKGKTVAYPLMTTSSFILITGASGSGKSNLMISLLKGNKSTPDKKHKLSYNKMFDKVIYVSPSAGTIKNSPLENISDDQKHEALTDEVFDQVEEIGEDAIEEGLHNLWILDDVSSQLRGQNENRLNQIVKNRRHKNLTIWIIAHKITDLSPKLRSNLSQGFFFKPKTNKEIDAIQTEYMLLSKKDADVVMGSVFKTRYDFMLIDSSLRNSAKFEFFRNFNRLVLDEEKEESDNK